MVLPAKNERGYVNTVLINYDEPGDDGPDGQSDRIDRILDATETLIAERGYDRIRLIDVADAAGVSVGSLQHRFRSRENLLKHAIDHADARERREWLARESRSDDPWVSLRERIGELLALGQSDRPSSTTWLELVSAASRHPELRTVMSAQQELWAQTLTDTIQSGFDAGRFSSDISAEDIAVTLLALVDGFFVSRNVDSVGNDAERVTRLINQVLERLIVVNEAATN
jgi:AcrR family transcriptional regulator